MLKIEEITNKKIWEDFLDNPKVVNYPLFQSWNFGVVQEKMGSNIWRIGVYDNKKLVGICQIIDVNARRGHYLHLRHGPVLNPFNPKVFDTLIEYIKNLARKNSASFIRLSPVVESHLVPQDFLSSRNMHPAPIHKMDAELCWVLDITKSEEELLSNMRKSHRYLIRKALADKSLKIIKSTNLKDMDRFIPLYKHLSKRKHFVPHRGVREEFEVFKKDNQSMLFLVEYQKKIIAGGLFDFVGKTAIYRHSASNEEYRNIPGMYLMLWSAVEEAKKRNMHYFNFWGVIKDSDSKSHPWYGLSLFKKGFGGEEKEFLHAQDLPLSFLYGKTWLIEYFSKLLKGY